MGGLQAENKSGDGKVQCSDITNDQFGFSEETVFRGGNHPV